MEQFFPAVARRSVSNRSQRSLGSTAPLGENAAPLGFPVAEGPGATHAQHKMPFYKKRGFIISQAIIIPLGIALLFIILFPVVKAIVQLVVKRSTLSVDVAEISQPSNNSFALHLEGNVYHTGIFNARIQFTQEVQVSWVQDNGSETALGTMQLDTLHASHKRATINQNTTFRITDEDAFGLFAEHMITGQNFTWRLKSDKLRVQALKFPVANGITFDKILTLNGFNSFNGNVLLESFQLPQDHEGGGIDFIAATSLTNPSPFKLNLGTVVFDLSYKNLTLGTGTGVNTVISPGDGNLITLSGFLQPQQGDSNLATMGELFTQYINGENSDVIAIGKSTLQNDGTVISWLSKGLQALNLHVPFKPREPISPIKSITIGDFALAFDPGTSWTPSAESRTVQAFMALPFGFNVSIGQIQNDLNITQGGMAVAGLATPIGASTSNIKVNNASDTSGTIDIVIQNTNLSCSASQHPMFSSFNAALTNQKSAEFYLVGNSKAVASMSIGQITLDPIKVNVSTQLLGLQGLKGLTTIDSVDVLGGTPDAINLGISVSITNPSNLKLYTGDLNLALYRDDARLGTATLPALNLSMGDNRLLATSSFTPNENDKGLQTLNDFIGQKDVPLSIGGFGESTQVLSLVQAFNTLDIDVVLPGLKTNLLDSAALEVLSTTGKGNNMTHVTVDLANPFTAGLKITGIKSSIKSMGLDLGTIDTSTNFSSNGKSTTTSPDLDMNMNLDPVTLFTLTRALAVEAGASTAQLDGIVALGGYTYLFTTGPGDAPSSSRDGLYRGFDLPNYVKTAFKRLQSDVELIANVNIGDYATQLTYSQNAVPTKTDDSLSLILPILAQPIVQKIIDVSILGIETVMISDPQQESFNTQLKGSIRNAGPFDAKISFPSGLTIAWQDKPLGSIKMDDLDVIGDVGATIDLSSLFSVADVGHLTEFTKVLLNEESFDWVISGDNLTVSALGIQVSGVSLSSKKVTLKGFNGLRNGVRISTFDLPENDPKGGVHLTLLAETTNPSQVGIQLSSLAFNTYAGDIMIGPVATAGSITLAPQSTTNMSLVGRLLPQESEDGLAVVSDIFNNFIHGKDSNVSVHGANAGPSDVTWLNDGIKTLQVATILPNFGAQNIIQSISLLQMALAFTEDAAYSPVTSSNNTEAAFTIPFNFPVDIITLEQTITVGYKGSSFAQLPIPRGPAQTDVTQRIIHLAFTDVPFSVYDDQHGAFEQFLAETTVGGTQTLQLSGTADADASTAVGVLSLTDIKFSVESSIEGLQGLASRPVTVSSLDVNHGYSDYLLIKLNTQLYNPSNLSISTGDVSFSLSYQDQNIGEADINNMVIVPGDMSVPTDVHFSPQGDAASAAGRALLENYLQGVDADTAITGSTDSTDVESLKLALSELKLSPVTIPALHESIVTSAALTFPVDIVQTGIASAKVGLANPFTASINLLRVDSNATYKNITLGRIDNVDLSSSPIHADGHNNVTSQPIPFNFNLDPLNIISLLTTASQANDVDLGPLTELFQFVLDSPNFHPPVNTSVGFGDPACVSGKQFDVEGAILKALSGLMVDLAIDSSITLDDYATDLSFNQFGIPAQVDKTVLYTIGAVAAPIAQHLVDQAELAFTEAKITNISNDGFDLSLVGSLTNVGPLDARITFTKPINVNWNGNVIAQIDLPSVCAAANDGVPDYRTQGHLTIIDQDQFTVFATYLLHNEEFTWTISTDSLRLEALGTIFNGVSLNKNVSFKAFNGLPGVTISNFKLPSDDPKGGIHIEMDSLIPSPAQLGINMGTITFQSYFKETLVGPLSGADVFIAAGSMTTAHLSGRIVPQSGSDLGSIGELFSVYLAGHNQTLLAKGDTVQPNASGPVGWLSTAFKTLELEVTLPGQKFDVIQSIQLNDLSVTLQEESQTWAPPSSSDNTLATYKNPFGFSLQVIESGESIILSQSGNEAASLEIPKVRAVGGISTGNVADLQLNFQDIPLQSMNNHAFQALFAAVTLQEFIPLSVKGTANVTARTTIGDVPIGGIPFDLTSTLKGINSFDKSATLSNVSVAGSGGNGGSEYIRTPLTTKLINLSNVSLSTNDVTLPVIYQGTQLGRAAINTFNLIPGENMVAAEFHYMPDNANDTIAQSFLTDFITTGNQLDLTITGDMQSTPYDSLQPALDGVQLSTSLTGMNQPTLITHINVYITLSTLVTNEVQVDFDIQNPLDADLVIEFVQSDASVQGEVYARFSQGFNTFVVPSHGSANSGKFPHVLLVKGALASLQIIPLGYLDTANAITVRVGPGGYQIPWLRTQQADVPTTYHLDVLGLDLGGLLDKAEEIEKCGVTALTDNGCPSSSVSGRLFGGLTSIAGGIFSSLRSAATLTSAGGLMVGPTAQPTSSRSNEGGDHSISSTSDPHSPQPTMSSSGLLG